MGEPAYNEPDIPVAPEAPPAPEPPPEKNDADVQQDKKDALEKKQKRTGGSNTLLKQTGATGKTGKKTLLGQ